MKPFDEWLMAYLRFQQKAGALLNKPLPDDLGNLHREAQTLEPLRWEAEGFAAAGAGRYYKAKALVMQELWSEVAKTALHDVAKSKCHKELWAREDSTGILESVKSRIYAVNAQIKRLQP